MFSLIKSKYILAEIFDFLKVKQRLKLIVHNKNMQEKLDINNETYRQNCGKYIELNGDRGKEYLNEDNILIFEGHYKNLKRNGQGKEIYKNGNIQFEGEYKEGKRWNGKTYNFAGIEEFEIINGTGNIREYNIYGIKIYEGDIVNGVKEGFGQEFFEGKLEYEGIFVNGKRDVEGTEYYPSGKIEYQGGYKFGSRHGNGKEYELDENLKYEGNYVNGFWNGNGKEYNCGMLAFSGIFKSGKRWDGVGYDNNGKKLYELDNGCGFVKEYSTEGILIFEGDFKNGVKYGKGKEYNSDKKLIYEGNFINGKRSKGKGKDFTISGKLKYEGEFLDGEWEGMGTEYEINGEVVFKGEFKKGKRWKGWGKEFHCYGNKLEYEGEYLNGGRSGKGKEYSKNGELIFEGIFLNNKRWKGKGKEYFITGKLKYDGYYDNGVWNGEGIEYNNEGRFKGEFLNGQKWNGIETETKYDEDKNPIYNKFKYDKGKKTKDMQ